MSDETYVTVKGRLTGDPELRYAQQSGDPVSNFTVATRARRFDKQANEWRDQPTKFWRCAAWDQGKLTRAQNIANMLKKGDSVIVYGELVTREYEDKEGNKRTADEIRIESIGKDLTFHGQAYATNEQPATQRQDQGWGGNTNQSGGWGDPAASGQGGWGNSSGATY